MQSAMNAPFQGEEFALPVHRQQSRFRCQTADAWCTFMWLFNSSLQKAGHDKVILKRIFIDASEAGWNLLSPARVLCRRITLELTRQYGMGVRSIFLMACYLGLFEHAALKCWVTARPAYCSKLYLSSKDSALGHGYLRYHLIRAWADVPKPSGCFHARQEIISSPTRLVCLADLHASLICKSPILAKWPA